MSLITFCAACGESIPSREAGQWTLAGGQPICHACHEALRTRHEKASELAQSLKKPLARWMAPVAGLALLVVLAVSFGIFGPSDAEITETRRLKDELPATEALLVELEKLSARTSVGLSFREYPSLLSPVAFQAKRWAQSDDNARAPNHIKDLLVEALDDYQFIHDAWRWHVFSFEDLRFDSSYITLFNASRIARYSEDLSAILPNAGIAGKADAKTYAEYFVQAAMKHASAQVDAARRLMNAPRSNSPAK